MKQSNQNSNNKDEQNYLTVLSQFNEQNKFGMVILALSGNEDALNNLPMALALFEKEDAPKLAKLCLTRLAEPDFKPLLTTIVSILNMKDIGFTFKKSLYDFSCELLEDKSLKSKYNISAFDSGKSADSLDRTQELARAVILASLVGGRADSHRMKVAMRARFAANFFEHAKDGRAIIKEAVKQRFEGFSINGDKYDYYSNMYRGPGSKKVYVDAVVKAIKEADPETQVEIFKSAYKSKVFISNKDFGKLANTILEHGHAPAIKKLKERVRDDINIRSPEFINTVLEIDELKDVALAKLRELDVEELGGCMHAYKTNGLFLQKLEALGEHAIIKKIAAHVKEAHENKGKTPYEQTNDNNPVKAILSKYGLYDDTPLTSKPEISTPG